MAETFDGFVAARGPGLLRFAYVLCGDRHLAEDLVQDVLARVHRRWSRIEELAYPEAYVRKAVVHEFLSWRRRPTNREVVATYLVTGRLSEAETVRYARGLAPGSLTVTAPFTFALLPDSAWLAIDLGGGRQLILSYSGSFSPVDVQETMSLDDLVAIARGVTISPTAGVTPG